MANCGLFVGFVVLLSACGADSADPVLCATQLHRDLAWYDAVVKNITTQREMGHEAKLSAMCRALFVVVTRAAQLGCPLSRISELQNRQRNLVTAGATACLAARPQTPASQLQSSIPRTVAPSRPVPVALQSRNPSLANRNMYDVLDSCDLRIRNCYLQFQINLLMRFGLRYHTCDIIESFASCLLSLRHCGFSPSLKPLIIKQAISSTQFALWETKECPKPRYIPASSNIIKDTTTTASRSESTKSYNKETSTDCGRASFKCVNGNCVSLESVCNTADNCGDGSDEIGCQTEDRRHALEIEKIFVRYSCYDVMSSCTTMHVRPLLLLLQAGQLSSLESVCKASNKVFHCAVHESCPLSAEDRARLSSLLIYSFEQLVSREKCQLIDVKNESSAPSTNGDATMLNSSHTENTTIPPSTINSDTLFINLANSILMNFTSTEGTTDFRNTTNTADISNFISTKSISNFTNTTSNPDVTDFNTTSNLDFTDFNTTSSPDFTDLPTTSNQDFTNFNTTSNPDFTDFDRKSNPNFTDFTNSMSNPEFTDFTNTTSNADFTELTNTTGNPGFTDFTNTTSTVIITNNSNFSNPASTDTATTPNVTETPDLSNSSGVTSPCVTSCDGLQSGNYQSCAGCNMFATCSGGVIYDKRPCPAALLWDDASKRCDLYSSTCQSSHACMSSCNGLQSGDYQSCQGCNVYLTCNNGVMQDNRPCQAGLVWNDINKRCEQFSTTCVSSGRKTETPKCVRSCDGLAPGNYQSCLGCNVYVSCDNGVFTDNRPCPNFMLWDDTVKRCENVSETCA